MLWNTIIEDKQRTLKKSKSTIGWNTTNLYQLESGEYFSWPGKVTCGRSELGRSGDGRRMHALKFKTATGISHRVKTDSK